VALSARHAAFDRRLPKNSRPPKNLQPLKNSQVLKNLQVLKNFRPLKNVPLLKNFRCYPTSSPGTVLIGAYVELAASAAPNYFKPFDF